MHKLPPLSLYIHIPWCTKKCPYCDYNSHTIKITIPHHEYIEHLLADLDKDYFSICYRDITSIFIGGGTPSLLSIESVQELLDGIHERLSIKKDAEITIEANPNSIDVNRFAGYKLAGINRISIGIQSFSLEKLISLGRIHNSEEAKKASNLATKIGLNFNLDLMHGLPNQTIEEALNDLHQAIIFEPPHISWYQLTIEPNTLFGSHPPVLPDDDTLWQIFSQGHVLLTEAGYQQYEISAYAKPGYQCHHNLNYWRFGDYLGIGCGAHSKITNYDGSIFRTVKTRHPRGYMRGNYIEQRKEIDLKDLPVEFFMNRFRLIEPTPRSEFSFYTGLDENVLRLKINRALKKGYITESVSHWQITEYGKLFLNSLLEEFLPE